MHCATNLDCLLNKPMQAQLASRQERTPGECVRSHVQSIFCGYSYQRLTLGQSATYSFFFLHAYVSLIDFNATLEPIAPGRTIARRSLCNHVQAVR